MVWRTLGLLLISAASALQPAVLGEARRRVEAATAAVGASARPRGMEAERRGYELARLGHDALGRGYNVTETSEILARMLVWLAGPEGRAASAGLSGEEGIRRLIELAARHSHPEIASGRGTRGASNWSDFIVGAAALRPTAASEAVLAAAHLQ